MTTFLTPRQLADRTSAAVEAAVSASRALGLAVSEPAVLHDVFSVVVHLAPSPVVARIPTVLPDPGDLAALARRQQDELDVTRWLDGQGVPVIAPSPLVPYEPVQRNGFSMTFWTFVEEDRDAEPDYVANAERVADLHAALRTYPGRPEFLSAADPEFITDSLDRLGRHPTLIGAAELDRARREWQALEPLVRSRAAFEARFPGVGLLRTGHTGARGVGPGRPRARAPRRLRSRRTAQRCQAARRRGSALRRHPGHDPGRRHPHAGPAASPPVGIPQTRLGAVEIQIACKFSSRIDPFPIPHSSRP